VAVSLSAVDFRTGFRTDLGGIREVIGRTAAGGGRDQGLGATELPWTAPTCW